MRIDLKELLAIPCFVVVGVGFTTGVGEILDIVRDAIVDPPSMRQFIDALAPLNLVAYELLVRETGWIVVALVSYLLGRLHVRWAQIVAGCTIIAMPMSTILLLVYLNNIFDGQIHIFDPQLIMAKILAVLICIAAWLLGFRRSVKMRPTIDLQHDADAASSRVLAYSLIPMVIVALYGWGTIAFLRGM